MASVPSGREAEVCKVNPGDEDLCWFPDANVWEEMWDETRDVAELNSSSTEIKKKKGISVSITTFIIEDEID